MREKQLNLFGLDDNKTVLKKRHNIIMPLDTLIMLVIVIVLLLSLSFSLGVERGRKLTYLTDKEYKLDKNLPETIDTSDILTAKTENKKTETMSNVGVITPLNETAKNRPQAVENKQPQTAQTIKDTKNNAGLNSSEDKQNTGEKYIIQVATYLKENMANREAEKLEDSGYPAFVSKKGKFMVIFVGEFNNKEKAEEKMKVLKKKYNDCILRRL